jgi:hypothetical protein
MWRRDRGPTTARALRATLEPFGPGAEGDELALRADPPAGLLPLLRVLHTGVRALLAGRRWYGCDAATGRTRELDPAAPIPAGVTLLAVEGDRRWDRIHPAARLDLPALFEAEEPAPGRLAGRSTPIPHERR